MTGRSVFHVGGVFDPLQGEVSQPTSITIENGLISSLGYVRGRAGFDARHLIAAPGLIDSHTHLSICTPGGEAEQVARPIEERTLRAAAYCELMLREGVTTIRGMGEPGWFDIQLRHAFRQGLLRGPRIVPAGKIIAPTHADVALVDDPADGEQVVTRARENLVRRVDWLKIYATPASGLGDPTESYFSEEEIRMVVGCATRAGIGVAAHAHGGLAVDHCIEAGVRTIEHGRYLSEAQLESMVAREVALCSTVVINAHQQALREGCTPQEALPTNRQSVAAALAAGVTVIPGSDAVHGHFRFELEALEFFGMDRLEALRAATVVAADVLGLASRGRIAIGLEADVALLEGNPLDAGEYPQVAATLVAGDLAWTRADLLANPSGATLQPAVLAVPT